MLVNKIHVGDPPNSSLASHLAVEFTGRRQILPCVWSCLCCKCFLGALLCPVFFWAVFYFSSAMIVFFSNTAKHGNISVCLGGPGNFPFRFAKTTIWQAASWHDTACVNLCRFQATLFIVNLLNSLWEQTCSPLSNRHSCRESQWPNRAHCALCVQSWDVKSASGQHPQHKTQLVWGHLGAQDWWWCQLSCKKEKRTVFSV